MSGFKKLGRIRIVKKLQTLLVKSLNARVLAVKRVSENRGKRTSGVDELKIDLSTYKSLPLKRIEIPKKNGKIRPLEIYHPK